MIRLILLRCSCTGGFTVRANASREMNHSFAGTESRFAFSRETSNMAVLSRRQITIIMLLRRRLRRKNINKTMRNKRRFWVRQIYRERKQICCNSETTSELETMFASGEAILVAATSEEVGNFELLRWSQQCWQRLLSLLIFTYAHAQTFIRRFARCVRANCKPALPQYMYGE